MKPAAETEYIVWGIAPGDSDEQILTASLSGKPITSRKLAQAIIRHLESNHACASCRIQELDGKPPDFTEGIGL